MAGRLKIIAVMVLVFGAIVLALKSQDDVPAIDNPGVAEHR